MQPIRVRVLILITMLVFARSDRGQAPTSAFPSYLILERFAVSTEGEFLLVPIRVAEKVYFFVVDTGSAKTVFSTSFKLGPPTGEATAVGSDGNVEINLYRPPAAKLGRTSLGSLGVVARIDLDSLGEVASHPINGVLGMDFLGRHVVHIDVAKGELLLLKAAPINAGVALPISWEPGGVPFVKAEIAPGEQVRFLVDTGSAGWFSGSLGISETQSPVSKRLFREVGKSFSNSISGLTSRPLFQGRTLSLGGLDVQSPVFSEARGLTPNILGLGFWSRFEATFDFPARKLYLRKSANFGQPDRWNATDLHLGKAEGLIERPADEPKATSSPPGR
jgi:hypothetical protein